MKTMLVLFGAVSILAWPAFANADFDLLHYDKIKETESFKSYMGGVGKGYFYANIELTLQGKPKLYCQPGKLALHETNYLDILDRYLARPESKNIPQHFNLEYILLQGLKETFPCR